MKLINRCGFAFLMMVLCSSCEVKQSFDYTAGNQIFFTVSDSVTYSFATKASTLGEDVLSIPIGTSGFVSDKAREVIVRIDPSKTSTAVANEGSNMGHYSLGKAIIPAGGYVVNLPMTIYRRSELALKEVCVYLEIVTSNEFMGDLGESKLKLKVKINDILTKPTNWDSYIKRYFGTYGPVKYQYIIDKLGISEFSETGENAVPKAMMAFYKDKLKAELIKDGPLYEDGNIKVDFDI